MNIRQKLREEHGFMGMTHALSAVAVILVLFAFKPEWYIMLFQTDSLSFLTLIVLVTSGGALMPDLDNTASSAKSALGFIGDGISAFMRMTAPIIQKILIHTKYDDTSIVHRGFYHFGIAAVLFGGLFTWLCSLGPVFAIGSFVFDGKAISILLAFVASHIALSTLFKKALKKSKSGVIGFILPLLLSIGVTAALISMLPDDANYSLIGVAFGLGWLIHEIGDCFTTQGDPILAPLKIKGKQMYNIRFLPIQAGGVIENMVFVPTFVVIIIIAIIAIIKTLTL